jgi:hypothetical protein
VAEPEPPPAAGPPVRLLAIYPADGDGQSCAPNDAPECGVPINASLTLRFDRFLDPASVNRQAIRVFTGDPAHSAAIPFDVHYDPIERVVEYRMPRGYAFVARAVYQIELVVPETADDFGIRAFDGALLAPGDVPLAMSFQTAEVSEQLPVEVAPTCDEIVYQVLKYERLGNCASQHCHSSEADELLAPVGLWLDGKNNLRITAIGRVAHETEFGDSAGVALQDSPRFGVQMPLIDPQNPGNSYLLYKLIRHPNNFDSCREGNLSTVCLSPADPSVSLYPKVPLPEGDSLVPSRAESERLREWFVRGDPMPLPQDGVEPVGVSLQGLRAISSFIAAGASCGE